MTNPPKPAHVVVPVDLPGQTGLSKEAATCLLNEVLGRHQLPFDNRGQKFLVSAHLTYEDAEDEIFDIGRGILGPRTAGFVSEALPIANCAWITISAIEGPELAAVQILGAFCQAETVAKVVGHSNAVGAGAEQSSAARELAQQALLQLALYELKMETTESAASVSSAHDLREAASNIWSSSAREDLLPTIQVLGLSETDVVQHLSAWANTMAPPAPDQLCSETVSNTTNKQLDDLGGPSPG